MVSLVLRQNHTPHSLVVIRPRLQELVAKYGHPPKLQAGADVPGKISLRRRRSALGAGVDGFSAPTKRLLAPPCRRSSSAAGEVVPADHPDGFYLCGISRCVLHLGFQVHDALEYIHDHVHPGRPRDVHRPPRCWVTRGRSFHPQPPTRTIRANTCPCNETGAFLYLLVQYQAAIPHRSAWCRPQTAGCGRVGTTTTDY